MATSTRPQPLPVQRDEVTRSHTRNKENIPSPSPFKAALNTRGRSFIPSLVQSSDKSDFFTDSYLADENASSDSLIPSPLPQSTALSRPRRRLHPLNAARDQDSRPHHRSTRSEALINTQKHLSSSSSKPLARGTSPIRSIGLSTPPRSRNGSLTESPTSAQFSSPPRALTETYERIDQEEDLAATEGEISDPDSEPEREDNAGRLDDYIPSTQAFADPPHQKAKSPGITPTGLQFPSRSAPTRSEDLTTASVLSDPTGMSFLNQLSDPNLAHAMTPHIVQSAADKEALRRIWDTKRPIAFGKANKVHLDADHPVESIESPHHLPPQRLVAFSKAGKRKLASDLARFPLHQRTFSDITDRLEHNTQEARAPAHNDNWHNDDLRREALPHNPRIHRAPYFSRTHGFPERQQPAEANGNDRPMRQVRSESPFAPSTQHTQVQGQHRKSTGAAVTDPILIMHPNQSEPDLTMNSRGLTQTSSNVDWAQAATSKVARAAEIDPPRRSQSRQSDTTDYETSPEKSRRFDLDFTGQSFQVSESPPVRTKSLNLDSSREREIRGLEKRAVTTNRLSQLRARESLEKLRQSSISPVSEIGESQNNPDQREVDPRTNGEHLPDTPVAVYRSRSIGSGRKSSATPPVRPSPDRAQSHDLLQRLARSSSSTPRSSTPSNVPVPDVVGGKSQQGNGIHTKQSSERLQQEDNTTESPAKPSADIVNATPKVTGGWTDTILPDTIKTVKQHAQRPVYSQTPHVSAGGWIDTPAPISQSLRLESVPESTQEIPAELMHGIVKDSNDESDQTIIAADSVKSAPYAQLQNTQTVGNKILSDVKDNADDSLVLGNDTMQSLQNVLDMDQTDITIISHLSESMRDELAGHTETQVLERIGNKLDRVRKQIHDAHKGISKLESQMLQPEQNTIQPGLLIDASLCEVCGQQKSPEQRHDHPLRSQTYFPFTVLNITLPIPVLFRTRSAANKTKFRFPQPTPLGWIVLTVWTWYILECTLAEIYSHPVYASHYVWPTESEPDFPFVLPTMLWRWSRLRWVYPSLIQPLLRILVGLYRMVGMSLGLIDGYVDGPQDVVVERLVETVYQSVETGIAGMDMMNDEFL